MKAILIVLAVLLAVGVILALVERRQRRIFFKHDLNLRKKGSPHTEGEIIRAQDRAVHDWNRPH